MAVLRKQSVIRPERIPPVKIHPAVDRLLLLWHCEELDDIEWELSCSLREASVGCVPVAHVEPWG